ncbi:MAG TPA: GNAT family N-acetyltransferase [Pseudonocardia sp.]|nr:GNAT family N-acetyltransferase [Pseudonocardia sp.]
MTTTAIRSTVTARSLTEDELPEYLDVVASAFLSDPHPTRDQRARALLAAERVVGVFDGDRLIGGGTVLAKELTLPGAVTSPVGAISYVGVRPDARGRGALSTLMRTQLDRLHGSDPQAGAGSGGGSGAESGGAPIAALWASMAPLYGRFGYGLASRHGALTVPGRAPFRDGAPIGGAVGWLDEAAAAEPIRAVHRGLVASRVGWVSRPELSWRWWLGDDERDRGGATAYRFAVHRPRGGGAPDGYAVFRLKPEWAPAGPDFDVELRELVAATPQAHAGLWRALLDLDMVGRVRYHNVALDDPISLLLADARAKLTDVADALWIRLVELDRALAARRYAAPANLVLAVTDAFCPWNAGRWRLRVAGDGTAEVTRTEADADLMCDTTDLASAYLGGIRLAALAAAGRVRELRPGAVRAASLAMAGEAEPYCLEVF